MSKLRQHQHELGKARELVALRASILHRLVEIEQAVAGTMPLGVLRSLYLAAKVSQEEFVEILEAAGWTAKGASAELAQFHALKAPEHWPAPTPVINVDETRNFNRPGRKPSRSAKATHRLTGHPLDEE